MKLNQTELRKMVAECLEEIKATEIPITIKMENLEVCTMYSTTIVGRCTKGNNNDYTIEINDKFVEVCTDFKTIKNTICHELLHTIRGCLNHGSNWKRCANTMNRQYGYNITRLTKVNLYPKQYKYTLQCKKCLNSCNYVRKSKLFEKLDKLVCAKCHNIGFALNNYTEGV